MSFQRSDLIAKFEGAIDVLERALRECPDELWEASVWRVSPDDPWMWPAEGIEPIPERTEESIQAISAFWAVAYHCLWYLDFYLTTDMATFRSLEAVRGGPEEQGMAADGAARLPSPIYPREILLEYLDYGRRRALALIPSVTDNELQARCPPGHPHAGKSLEQLLGVNLAHLREHGGDLVAFVENARG
jgi:DinB family protein